MRVYAESRYVKSSIFTEFYVGGGSPSVLLKTKSRKFWTIAESISISAKNAQRSLLHARLVLLMKKSDYFPAEEVDQLDIGIQTFDEEFRKILMLRDNSTDAQLKLKVSKEAMDWVLASICSITFQGKPGTMGRRPKTSIRTGS